METLDTVSYTHLDVYKRQGIDHITTTEYRPQGNIAERYLRNLKSALISYHANDHTSWDQNLSWIQFAFNSAYHEGHKSTPFELLFKYKPNHPLSTKWKIHDLLPLEIRDKNIKKIWNEARANLRTNLAKSRKYHERKNNNNEVKYQIGDLVMYKTHPTSSAIDKTTDVYKRQL